MQKAEMKNEKAQRKAKENTKEKSNMKIRSINPTTGELIKEYEELSENEVSHIIKKVDNSFQHWKRTSFTERAKLMKEAARILRANAEEYAKIMAIEMGKPIKEGKTEAMKCALVCDYYAENAHIFLQPETIKTDANESFVIFQPLGIILAIMPWNFPFWQVFRFAAPALMAGNAGILKHASNVPACALSIEDIFQKAGFPKNIFRTLLISGRKVESIIENPLVRSITLTGSDKAGKIVAQKAGEQLKKCVLELGGSDPYLILDDADLVNAVESCITSKLINSGQSCIAAKRFIVLESVQKAFEELFVKKMSSKKMGNPLNDDTIIGPLARYDLRDELHLQVQKSIKMGAKCLLGGFIPPQKSAFYPPTVLTNVKKGMPAYEEEMFGPVAAIISVKNEEEAIKVANDTVFGLGAAVFTENIKKGKRIASFELEAGSCFVNTFVKSDPRLPFGGIKESGFGRELSHYGIKEFVNIKIVYVK